MAVLRFSACVFLIVAATWRLVDAVDFLSHSGRDLDSEIELRNAMASIMGCGSKSGTSSRQHIDEIKLSLTPMWETLPKNRWGKVEWRMVRSAAHRYFIQRYSFLVKGLEPTRRVNSTTLGSAQILSGQDNSIVDALLQGKVNGQGFSFDDVAFMLATLEQLIYDRESNRLEQAYRTMGRQTSDLLAHQPLVDVIETFMVMWMLGDDQPTIDILIQRPSLRMEVFPLWQEVRDFATGMVRKMEFEASLTPHSGVGRAALQRSYSFDDAHQAVIHITKNFAFFWEAECQSIKASLVAMDKFGTGRLAISDFYGANSDGEWRFGESESYLRELGSLDETSAVRGKQVIIPNYLLGASNCIVSSAYYLVCCVNECEDMLNDIQGVVGSPMASVGAIVGLVSNMSNFDDDPPAIDDTLMTQLQRIAQMHGGQVPLHGRLFAQWMHFVFPRECPYPHKAGSASTASLVEFGQESYASEDEVRGHSAKRAVENMSDVEEAQWMTQWSEEEELSSDELGAAPWERVVGNWIGYGFGALAMLGLVGSLLAGAGAAMKSAGDASGTSKVSHFL